MMESGIAAYEKAYGEMQAAEQALDRQGESAMKECITIADHYALIDKLPKHYRGIRRIYQKINEMDAEGKA